jgi:uncharacterized membrane protein YczE
MPNEQTACLNEYEGTPNVWLRRSLFYVAGLFILAFGISVSIRSALGVAPVSSVPLVLSVVTGMEIGNATVIVFTGFVMIQLLLLGKRFRWRDLLQVPCAILFGKFITLTNGMLEFWMPGSYIERLMMVLFSTVAIGIGVKLYLLADIVPQSADGLVVTISKTFDWELANVKNGFDIGSVVLAAGLSFAILRTLTGVREGTVIIALGVGRVIWLINRHFGDWLQRICFGSDARRRSLK